MPISVILKAFKGLGTNAENNRYLERRREKIAHITKYEEH